MKETNPMVALPPFPGGCAPALPADVTPKRSPDCPMEGIAIADSNGVCIRLETAGGR